MNTFEVTFHGQKRPIIVKADYFSPDARWITFYDKSVASDVKIVAVFSAENVLCVIRKDKINGQD